MAARIDGTGLQLVIPDWCNVEVPTPSMDLLRTNEQANAAIQKLVDDTMQRHRIAERYSAEQIHGPSLIIKKLSEALISELRKNGPYSITSVSSAISLVASIPESNLYKVDNVVKLAMESLVVGAFWRYVPIEGFIESPAKLLSTWKNFEHERSHWWRAKRAAETDEHIRNKWETLLADLPNLLDFHNCLLHARELAEKPTLKHTCHISSLTAEGRIYENGQGRSIASECRHILVRTFCNIPIKSRPERRTAEPPEKKERKKRVQNRIELDEDNLYEISHPSFADAASEKRPRRNAARLAVANMDAQAAFQLQSSGSFDDSRPQEDYSVESHGGVFSYGSSEVFRADRSYRAPRIVEPTYTPLPGAMPAPPNLHRQRSADTWPEELAKLGDKRTSVPVFSVDMYESIRRNCDGTVGPDAISNLGPAVELLSAMKKSGSAYPNHVLERSGSGNNISSSSSSSSSWRN